MSYAKKKKKKQKDNNPKFQNWPFLDNPIICGFHSPNNITINQFVNLITIQ